MEFILKFLAGLFEKFRIANPTAAAIVLLLLSAITYTATQGSVLGLFNLSGFAQSAVSLVSLFLTAVIGGGSAGGKK